MQWTKDGVATSNMSTFVNNDVSPGALVQASDHNTQGALVAAVLNGGIENANVNPSAAIATSKLADDAGIGTAKLTNAGVTNTKVADGFVVQGVSSSFSAVATGTTAHALDDTIPQNTEGIEFMTLAITPKSATNILVIRVVGFYSNSLTTNVIQALFQDSTADALAVTAQRQAANAVPVTVVTEHRMVAGTTSSTTFKARTGSTAGDGGTLTFNGTAGARKFGAITKSSITITEYKAS